MLGAELATRQVYERSQDSSRLGRVAAGVERRRGTAPEQVAAGEHRLPRREDGSVVQGSSLSERFSLADEGEGVVLRLGHEGARKVSMLTRAPWVLW